MRKLLLIISLVLVFYIFSAGNIKALTGITRPDGDAAVQWTSTGTNNYTELTSANDLVEQPTAPDTNDYVNNGGSVQNVDRYSMDNSITNVDSVSAIDVWIYGYDTKGNSALSVDLYWDGSLQQQGSVTTGGSYGWVSDSFTGLTLSQTQLDSLEVEITADSGGRTYYVAALYADVTYTEAPSVSISLTTDGSVAFGHQALDSTQDSSGDVEIISVDSGPADLDIKSTDFSDGTYTWTLSTSNGYDQVYWEFSQDGLAWSGFDAADTPYIFDTNVGVGETRPLYLQLTTPTDTSSYDQFNTTVTVIASPP